MIDSLRKALESFRLWAEPYSFLLMIPLSVALAAVAIYQWWSERRRGRR